MKLVTFDAGRVGRLEDEVVVELDCASTREYFERGGQVGETGERLPLADVRLRAPIVPKKFFHTAGNFSDHHEELQAVDWSHPVHKGIVFFQNVDAIIGPDDAIVYPEGLTKELDYELELAIIIGKAGKFFGPEEAEDYIAGYTVFNDITARDIQRREMQSGVFSFSKAIDTFCPIGPWIVTKDEVATPGAGDGAAGQRRGPPARQHQPRCSSRSRTWSRTTRRRATRPGTSSPPARSRAWRRSSPTRSSSTSSPGDNIEAEIEGVGVLRNHVVPWSAAHDTPPYSDRPVLLD
jgi:2-keto-4-pentenoate hydratase/2-oxohepta-3-ene-1,7-dioic acid hydratase in catechol pathway